MAVTVAVAVVDSADKGQQRQHREALASSFHLVITTAAHIIDEGYGCSQLLFTEEEEPLMGFLLWFLFLHL